MTEKDLFFTHLAQTSEAPVGIQIAGASGNYLIDNEGNRYLDLIGGISVCNTGHRHPAVVAAIQKQLERYLHVMVYGELIQSPQVQYATMLSKCLPDGLDCVYFTNSGAEATEGALKLARRYTGRHKIISVNKAYHGNTLGALSVMGDEYWRSAFRPLLPDVYRHDYNSQELLDSIDDATACVIMETVQGEAGVVAPDKKWLTAVRNKCTETNALFILDEIQTGFGRTGKLWGFEHFSIVPDVVLLGKALGGGMPLGAFVSSKTIMNSLTHNPVLGHITTFGGHPVCCAAGIAAFEVLLNDGLIATVKEKEQLFVQLLKHTKIREVRSAGLLIAVQLESQDSVTKMIQHCLKNSIFTDWFLFAPDCVRIAPPLTIKNEEIVHACDVIKSGLDL